MPTVDERRLGLQDEQISDQKRRIADLKAKIKNLGSGFQDRAMRGVLQKALETALTQLEHLEISRQSNAENIGALSETTSRADEAIASQQEIIDRVAKEGILGAEGLEKILSKRSEAVERTQGARDRQLARSAEAIRQRAGGQFGPRSGAARNIVLNKALAPAVGGIIQGGAEDAAFESDLIKANELSKTLQPMQGLQYISSFLQNRFGQQSSRDINLRNLDENKRQFDIDQQRRRDEDDGGGFNPFDLVELIPGISQAYSAFNMGKDLSSTKQTSTGQ